MVSHGIHKERRGVGGVEVVLPFSTCGVLVRGRLLAALTVVGTSSQLFTLRTTESSLGGTNPPTHTLPLQKTTSVVLIETVWG